MKKEGEEKTIILNVNSIQKQSIQQQLAMIAFIHLCISLFLNPQIIKAATANYPYTPTDHMLLNCGSPSRQTAADGQSWDGDFGTKLSPDINEASISFAANATEQNPSITGDVPYMTARIFNSQFSYSFPVSRGQKFLRLYFYPVTYSGNTLLKNQSFFSVTANQYSLLSNFSAYLSAQPTLVKEFIINVGQIQLLNVTFVPAANSYAFVNGIEVVSIPDNFYMGNHDVINNPIKLVPMQTPFEGLDKNTTAFESLYYYRLNVGGGAISGVNDTGMFREWFQDREFIFGGNPGNSLSNATITLQYTSQTPNYTAPSLVYTTAMAMGRLSKEYDLSWKFQVDSGFYYIVRLHFCEFMPYLINATGQRRFTILINNRTAELEADIIQWTGGTGIPVFRDYAVFVPNSSYNSQSKQELFLALRPDFANPSIYHDAILNGLEVFKLNSTAGSLAGPNPEPWVPDPKLTEKKKNSKGGHMRMIVGVLGGVTGGCAVLLALYFLLIYRRRQLNNKDFDRKSNSKSSWAPLSTRSRSTKTSASGGSLSLPSDLCRRDQLNLAEWARRCYKKGAVDQIVDPNLKGQISAECLRSFSEIAINCLKDQGVDRPAMSDVVWSLEFALQLQEAADKDGEDRTIFIPVISDGGEGEMTSSENDTVAMFTSSDLKMTAAESKSRDQSSSTTASFSTANSCDKLKPESVFSEIRNPKGR
ncbi:OLC1v1009783C1 [Oldenlandia corymbosa var. corymbosa]|uniref:OLC1v1009783C1 n=1 Tax=Oldenlandia corymbosa var. corymbosa TaxID=529605 RepID=A0AAV1DSY5_OLDCO|nr:OLC1v1009783C1 [Oldenlandia corymbosa var. corymbosa]